MKCNQNYTLFDILLQDYIPYVALCFQVNSRPQFISIAKYPDFKNSMGAWKRNFQF